MKSIQICAFSSVYYISYMYAIFHNLPIILRTMRCGFPNPRLSAAFPFQVYYYVVDSPRNEGKDYFEINLQSGEIFTKVVFDREKQGAYALEVEARDGAPSARPNSNQQPNSGESLQIIIELMRRHTM